MWERDVKEVWMQKSSGKECSPTYMCNRAVLWLFIVVLLLFIRSHDMLLFPVLRMNMLSVGPIVLQFIVPLLLTLVRAYMNTPWLVMLLSWCDWVALSSVTVSVHDRDRPPCDRIVERPVPLVYDKAAAITHASLLTFLKSMLISGACNKRA